MGKGSCVCVRVCVCVHKELQTIVKCYVNVCTYIMYLNSFPILAGNLSFPVLDRSHAH